MLKVGGWKQLDFDGCLKMAALGISGLSNPSQTSSVHPTTVLAHAIGDDASLLSHTEEVEDTARVAVNGFLPLNALLRRLLVTSFAPYVWPSTTWCVCEVPPCSIKRGTSAAPASKK